jgi:hypothetical protein
MKSEEEEIEEWRRMKNEEEEIVCEIQSTTAFGFNLFRIGVVANKLVSILFKNSILYYTNFFGYSRYFQV